MNQSTIEYVYKHYVPLTYEVCGNVDDLGNIFDVTLGQSQNSREFCRVKRYANINFHTHPILGKSYPSIEDMISVLKKRSHVQPKAEIIITKWGVWELRSDNVMVFDQAHIDYSKTEFEKISKKLYCATERGRSDCINILAINRFINDMETHFGDLKLHISFEPLIP